MIQNNFRKGTSHSLKTRCARPDNSSPCFYGPGRVFCAEYCYIAYTPFYSEKFSDCVNHIENVLPNSEVFLESVRIYICVCTCMYFFKLKNAMNCVIFLLFFSGGESVCVYTYVFARVCTFSN